MARTTHTPIRNIRVPDDVWQAAQAGAARDGTTVSAAIVDFLRMTYFEGWDSTYVAKCEHCKRNVQLIERTPDEWFYDEHDQRGTRCRGAGMRYEES